MPTRGLLLALTAATVGACVPNEPFPVPLQLAPQTLELPVAKYNEPAPFAAYTLKNVSGTLLFVTPAAPQGDRPDLLDIGFAPYTELLPGQTLPVEVAMDTRRWRWESGTFTAKLFLEGSYFFSGQPIDEPENPAPNSYPERRVQVYELDVNFSIDCDFDEDGFDALQCAGTDCDDNLASVNPDGIESCNGIDDDCDGASDENAQDETLWYLDADSDGFGDDTTEVSACSRPSNDHVDEPGDCDDDNVTYRPNSTEICNDGDDNDCDGDIDEAECN